MRAERDRFLAFAFAAADVLIEVDGAGKVGFAAGATRSLLGQLPEDLVGKSVLDLVTAPGKARLQELLARASVNGRVAPTTLKFRDTGRALVVTGSKLPSQNSTLFLALRAQPSPTELAAAGDGVRRPHKPALLSADDFSAVAAEALRAGGGGAPKYKLSLIEAEGLQRLSNRLDQRIADELLGEIGALLCDSSLNGDVASRLAADKYGLVHDAGADMQALQEAIADLARNRDPDRIGIRVSGTTMELGAVDGHEKDAVKALVYAISSFSAGRDAMSFRDLSEGSKPVLVDTVARIGLFRQTITGNRFEIAFQPVVALESRAVHHYEALVRFADQRSPFETITFAENVGLIADFDLAMVRKVLGQLALAQASGNSMVVAVNISGRSLESEEFLNQLLKVLQHHPSLEGRCLFEVTESAEIRDLSAASHAIGSLRLAGYPICLDDFGAGASTFHYLRALPIDYVKIDGGYIRDVLQSDRDRPFLKAMVQLCRDLSISAIGEMVEDEPTAEFLAGMGVEYAQGYLFGKPRIGLPAPKAGRRSRRLGSNSLGLR